MRMSRIAHLVTLVALTLLQLLFSAPSLAQLATKGTKPRLVAPSALSQATVSILEKKRTLTLSIHCLNGVAGKATPAKGNMMKFTAFTSYANKAESKSARARFKKLAKAGATACQSSAPPPEATNPPSPPSSDTPVGNPNPTPTPIPSGPLAEHLSLEKYTGPFGPAEARILLTRFAFGAPPHLVSEAVSLGLEGTVNKLLTVVSEPNIDALAADIECDGWRSDDPLAGAQNKQCSPDNINDFSRFGQRTAWLFRMIHSANAFQERLRLFVHDERMSVAQSAARDCEKHAIRTYMNDLWTLATAGDYKTYMRAMNNSHLVHLRWLDGASNQGGVVKNRPNENYAREFWELGTVGPTDLNGQPVYSDFDIAQSSLALTGWTINTITVNNNQVCLAARSPLLHTPGNKTIFAGTPWEAQIDNDEDLLNATFAHPRTSEHLAEDIWKQFIHYSATPDSIRSLAGVIRENNYNLLATFKTVMMSKALYAPQSRGALIKHPVERLVSFLKVSGFPLYYRDIDSVLAQLEQQPLNPPSVFGWDEKKTSSDSLLLAWRNVVINEFVNFDVEDLKKDYGWSYYDRFVADLNQQGKTGSLDVINRVAQDLGVVLTDSQRASLDQFLNFVPTNSGCPAQCNGNSYRLVREKYDTDPMSGESGFDWNGQRKIRGLITLLLTTRDGLVK